MQRTRRAQKRPPSTGSTDPKRKKGPSASASASASGHEVKIHSSPQKVSTEKPSLSENEEKIPQKYIKARTCQSTEFALMGQAYTETGVETEAQLDHRLCCRTPLRFHTRKSSEKFEDFLKKNPQNPTQLLSLFCVFASKSMEELSPDMIRDFHKPEAPDIKMYLAIFDNLEIGERERLLEKLEQSSDERRFGNLPAEGNLPNETVKREFILAIMHNWPERPQSALKKAIKACSKTEKIQYPSTDDSADWLCFLYEQNALFLAKCLYTLQETNDTWTTKVLGNCRTGECNEWIEKAEYGDNYEIFNPREHRDSLIAQPS